MTSPKTLLRAWNIRAKKQLGQNFLSEPSTASMILDRSEIHPEDTVLEIGSGLGALTIPLAHIAHKVYAVEKDKRLIDLLKTELLLHNLSNVTLIHENILNIDIGKLTGNPEPKIVVMGNLPYNISSQILIKLIKSRKCVTRAVLMFQKELAQRITAEPGGRDYGRLSAILQYCADIKPIATVKASLFFPKPGVDSTVLSINFHDLNRSHIKSEPFLFDVIKASFGRRRKTLKNSLSGSELNISANTAALALNNAGIDPVRRAETLEISEFIELANSLHSLLY